MNNNNYIVKGRHLSDIAKAIRNKTGATSGIKVDDMASAISRINGSELATQIVTRTITEYSNDSISEIGQYAFRECRSLTFVDVPNVTKVGSYAFAYCRNLSSVGLPNATTIGSYTFDNATSLRLINLPKVTVIDSGLFNGCNALTFADFGTATQIKSQCFAYCYRFVTLIIRSNTVCTLANTNAFNYCHHFLGTKNSTYNPNGDKDGYIYVPKDLVDSYKTATNWVTFADQIRAIEDYPEITGGII